MHLPVIPPFSAVAKRLFVCLLLFCCLCLKNPVTPPKNVFIHVIKTGSGQINVAFSDTIVPTGSKMTFKAVPDENMLFLGWFGSLQSTNDSVTFVVLGNMNIEAKFRPVPCEPQMVEICSKNKTFIMGSNAAVARWDERPAHSVHFNYTYFIDKYEVTQRHFESLMMINPSQTRAWNGTDGIGDNFPVEAVTWYEAAQFCNARSKAAGLDTVYEFTALCMDNQECPYVLENLVIHYDRFGFRLPTEAEWEYACRAGSTTDYYWGKNYPDTSGMDDYAWSSGNSENTLHPVGLKIPNAFGLFDMSGNAAEWVNDWLDPYRDSLAIDPVGPTLSLSKVFEDSLQRPARGGSFDLGKVFQRSSLRKGEYETWAKNYDKNTGFRCVLGALFPTLPSGTKTQADTSGVQSCNLSELLGFIGASKIKCVFIKETALGRKLYCIDFAEIGKPVHELSDSLMPYSPTISPNGAFVAYSSKGETGFSGASTVTVRRLISSEKGNRSSPSASAFVPRWWVDQNILDTFIIFPNNTISNDDPLWKTGKTYRQKVAGGRFVDLPKVICDTGAFNGGLSYDGVFLATGYKKAHVLNLTSNDLYNYFDSSKNGTSHSIQVCNVSMNPGFDNQDEIIFLDFGCPTISSIVGKSYGIHAIIFTATSADSIHWYEIPSGYDQWEDLEWSNHPRFAVAVAQTNADAEKSSIFCIDLQNRAYLKIAEGKNIREPFLWIDPLFLPPKPDPYYNFAKYNIPGKLSSGQIPLCMKLKLFWSQYNEIQCVAFGGSPMYYGMNPEYITRVKTLNMATIASNPYTSYLLASNYALSHVSDLKMIIMGLDAYGISSDQENPYLNGLPRTLGYQFDTENNFWKNGIPTEIRAKIALFDSTQWIDFYSNGYAKVVPQGNGWGEPTDNSGSFDYKFEDTTIQKNILFFKTFANKLAEIKIHFLVVNFPENPKYKQTAMIGHLGPNRTTYAQLSAWLKNLEQQNTYFHFYDANMDGDHDYANAEAMDCNHLNYLGAKKISARIDSLCTLYLK
jgi:formylglycine-generating enzyme required for sulfatase activity